MMKRSTQSGFTAVELLITLFVAAAFLIAGYQLFNVVIKDGGQTRAESRAANVAYDYLRQYSASSTTVPCSPSTPLNNASTNVAGLTNVTVTVAITCFPDAISSLSKVDVTISYNVPAQTVKYSTFSSSGGENTADVTSGLVAWWKLNGNANDSAGSSNGTVVGAIPTLGQQAQTDSAYFFNGSSNEVTVANNATLNPGSAITVSLWAKPAAFNGVSGMISKDVSSGFDNPPYWLVHDSSGAIVWGIDNSSNVPVTMTCSTNMTTNAWYHIVGTFDGSTMRLLVNGTACGTPTSQTSIATTTGLLRIGQQKNGSNRWFNGSIDDVRLYNRALSTTEVQTLYVGGAQ